MSPSVPISYFAIVSSMTHCLRLWSRTTFGAHPWLSLELSMAPRKSIKIPQKTLESSEVAEAVKENQLTQTHPPGEKKDVPRDTAPKGHVQDIANGEDEHAKEDAEACEHARTLNKVDAYNKEIEKLAQQKARLEQGAAARNISNDYAIL